MLDQEILIFSRWKIKSIKKLMILLMALITKKIKVNNLIKKQIFSFQKKKPKVRLPSKILWINYKLKVHMNYKSMKEEKLKLKYHLSTNKSLFKTIYIVFIKMIMILKIKNNKSLFKITNLANIMMRLTHTINISVINKAM